MADDQERLIVQLEARIDQFEKNMARANKTAEQNFGNVERRAKAMANALKSNMDKAAAGVTGAFSNIGKSFLGAAGIGGFGLSALMASVVKFNSELAKIPGLARTAALSTDRLQEIKFAANLKGVSDDEFASGLNASLRLLDEAQRNVNTLRRLFNANGESIRDQNGELIKFDQLLEIAARFIANARTEQEKIKIAEMLGLSREWVTVLRDGPAAFRASADAARGAGAVIDRDVLEKAKQFDREWTAAVVRFKAGVIEGLTDLSQAFTAFWNDIFDGMPGGSYIRDKMERWFGGLQGITIPELKDAIARSIEQGVEKVEIERLQAELDRRLGKAPGLRITVTPEIAPPEGNPTVVPKEKEKNPFDRAVFETNKRIAVTEAETAAIGANAGARERARLVAELEEAAKRANTEAGFQNATVTAEQRKRIDELSEAYAKAAQRSAEVKAAADLYFQSLQLGRTQVEQSVAAQLRQLYGDEYLAHMDSAIAKQIRLNEVMKDLKPFAEGALSGFLQDLAQGKSLVDSLSGVLTKLQNKLLDMAAEQLISGLFKGIGGMFGGMLGGPLGAGIGGGVGGQLAGALFHTGRGPGDPVGAWRGGVPASVFASAPRFHTGIGPGEMPAVIRRDESVLTPGQMRQLAPAGQGGAGPITVNVMNAPAGTTAEARTTRDGNGVKIDVMLKRMVDDTGAAAIASGESATNAALERRYGLTPKL